MRKLIACLCFTILAHMDFGLAGERDNTAQSEPRYTGNGELYRPTGYETWILAGTSIGMSYAEEVIREGPGNIHTVYINPGAYRNYVETGKFIEKTMFALVLYKPFRDVSINKHGYTQGEMVALEIALKDYDRFKEGWAYFSFPPGKKTARAISKESCYSCHVKHAADDNVFVQFYPILRNIKKGSQK